MKRCIYLLAFLNLLPLGAHGYTFVTDPTPEELTKLPIFAQTSSFTHSVYSNRMVRFRIYVRETGPLKELRTKTILLANPTHRTIYEGRLEYSDKGYRQGISDVDFVVDEECLSTSSILFTIRHYQGGQQQYRIKLQMLYEKWRHEDLDGYTVSNDPKDETNASFKAFMMQDFAPWNISIMKK